MMKMIDSYSSRVYWTSAIISSLLVLFLSCPTVIGSDRGRTTAKCPAAADLAGETRLCLADYTGQLDALLLSDNRFFPGLDVEVIRSLCSLLDDAMRCVRNTLIENCPNIDQQQQSIEDELSPHLGVRQLCLHANIYEDYAMNQNCFVRIRPDAEICYRNFMIAVQDDEPNERQSSSSLSSSQRHQAPQQRQYCNHVKRLISCVKNLVRSSTTSCQKMALRLVDVLVRASVPSAVNCRDEPNPSASPTQGKTSERFYDVNSSGKASATAQGSTGLLGLCCVAMASLVCLQSSFYRHALRPLASLLFHRPPPSATPLPPSPLPPSPPPPPLSSLRRRLRYRQLVDLLFS